MTQASMIEPWSSENGMWQPQRCSKNRVNYFNTEAELQTWVFSMMWMRQWNSGNLLTYFLESTKHSKEKKKKIQTALYLTRPVTTTCEYNLVLSGIIMQLDGEKN